MKILLRFTETKKGSSFGLKKKKNMKENENGGEEVTTTKSNNNVDDKKVQWICKIRFDGVNVGIKY